MNKKKQTNKKKFFHVSNVNLHNTLLLLPLVIQLLLRILLLLLLLPQLPLTTKQPTRHQANTRGAANKQEKNNTYLVYLPLKRCWPFCFSRATCCDLILGLIANKQTKKNTPIKGQDKEEKRTKTSTTKFLFPCVFGARSQ